MICLRDGWLRWAPYFIVVQNILFFPMRIRHVLERGEGPMLEVCTSILSLGILAFGYWDWHRVKNWSVVIGEEHLEVRDRDRIKRKIHISYVQGLKVCPRKKNRSEPYLAIQLGALGNMIVAPSKSESLGFIRALETKTGKSFRLPQTI